MQMLDAGCPQDATAGLLAGQNDLKWATRLADTGFHKAEYDTVLTNKAKYALRAMIDLAVEGGADAWDRPAFIGDIARRQDIPRRFLENILLELRKEGLVTSHRGKHGGYALARAPAKISFADVIRIIDGPLAFTPCTSRTAYERCADCPDEATCAIRRPLKAARHASAQILEHATLAEAAGLNQSGRRAKVVNLD